jgi:hypothetical protein
MEDVSEKPNEWSGCAHIDGPSVTRTASVRWLIPWIIGCGLNLVLATVLTLAGDSLDAYRLDGGGRGAEIAAEGGTRR